MKATADLTTLGGRVGFARAWLGISQAELAKRVGISPQAIQLIEAGKTRRTLHLAALATALNTSPRWLETGEGPRGFTKPDAVSFHELSDEVSREVLIIQKEMAKDVGEEGPFIDSNAIFAITDSPKYIPDQIEYSEKTIPVFVCFPIGMAIGAQEIAKPLQRAISASLGVPKGANVLAFVGDSFVSSQQEEADDFFPRPHYLKDIKNSYGIYTCFTYHMRPRIGNSEVLHVNPLAKLEAGDLVVAWDKSNCFVVAELNSFLSDDLHLTIYQNWPFNLLNFTIPKERLKAVHKVVGLQFTQPRSARLDALTQHSEQIERMR